MKKSYNPISDVRNESADLTKRLYRSISDAAHELDESRRGARSVSDLFAPRVAYQRARLRDACERLLMDGGGGDVTPTALAQMRKTEELLWRKVYYDVVAAAKRIRQGSSTNDSWQMEEMLLVHNHITAGVGLYHHLLWRLQCEHSHLDMNGITDSLVFFPDRGLKKATGRSGGHSASNGIDKLKDEARKGGGGGGGEEWAQQLAHRCLIYLGDLCRYLVDLQPGWDYGLATHYYTQALLLKPEAGLPHNQLGTMAGAQNYCLDAVYHYMRCLSCAQTFEGAEGNLNQLLDKHSWNQLSAGISCALARTVARLLSCARTWYCNRPPPPHPPMHKLCDDLIADLRECLHAVEDADPVAEPDDIELFAMVRRVNERPTRMTEEMLFKSVAIVLMCLHNLNKKGSSELSRGVSLQVSMMAQVLNQIMLKVESVLPPPPTPPPVANGLANRRRRRRRRKHRTSSGEESTDMSQGEEVEYLSDTDSDASEEKLIFDQNSSDSEEELNGETVNDTENVDEDSTVTNSKSQHYRDNLTFQHLHRLSQQGFLLQTIKICFDWLGSNIETLKTCGQTCKLFLDQAVSFFNHLLQVPYIFESNNDENLISNNCDRITISDELAALPLPEDICLRDLPSLVAAQKNIDWRKGLAANITSEEETYLRIYRLLCAGMQLTECGWTFGGKRRWFVTSQDGGRLVGRHVMTSRSQANRKRRHKGGQLVNGHAHANGHDSKAADVLQKQKNGVGVPESKSKLMGELWLRAEVRELETKVKRRSSHLPPYLVLDAEALTAHFALTKQLVLSKKFIVLIPSVVVSSLDEQKRESGCVRETIRWLEGHFGRGNRFVRAQRPNEHLTLPLIKYPKKKDKEAWMFFQIVECCHFLSNQGGKDQGLVTLLTGSPTLLLSSTSNGFSPLGIASSAGINIEHIESFHSKWKSSSKSHG